LFAPYKKAYILYYCEKQGKLYMYGTSDLLYHILPNHTRPQRKTTRKNKICFVKREKKMKKGIAF